MSWKITVDPARCVGSGMCAGVAPGYFTLSGGRSEPAAVPVDDAEEVLAAVQCCPMEAITVTDAATGTPVAAPGEEI